MAELNMLELGGFGGLILLALDVYALVSILSSRASTGAKVVWTLVVFFLPLLGFILWLFFGPRGSTRNA